MYAVFPTNLCLFFCISILFSDLAPNKLYYSERRKPVIMECLIRKWHQLTLIYRIVLCLFDWFVFLKERDWPFTDQSSLYYLTCVNYTLVDYQTTNICCCCWTLALAGQWECGAKSLALFARLPVCLRSPFPYLSSFPTSTTFTIERRIKKKCSRRISTMSQAALTYLAH